MRILGIIPARGGSKGIPKKNIRLLNGKPLIVHTIEAALASNLSRVVVSTDCPEIAGIAEKNNVEVIMRPECLATDETPTLPVLQDVISRFDIQYDVVMTLQPTSPLRKTVHINEAINLFESDGEADSLVSVVAVPHNFTPNKIMKYDGRYVTGNTDIKRRQEVETLYARNGAAIYLTRTDKLTQYIFGGKILPYFMNKIESFDIDDFDDFNIVSAIMRCNV